MALGLQRSWLDAPKRLIAAAEYGDYSAAMEGDGWEEDKEPPPMPDSVARIILCSRMNWRLLPWDLDDLDPALLRVPFQEYDVYDTFRQAGIDIEGLDTWQLKVHDSIWRLMNDDQSTNNTGS